MAQGEISNTFESITREWCEGRKYRWPVGYREDMMDAFEKDVFPYIGHRPIAEIKPLELLDLLSIMEKRGFTDKLKKVRQRCGEVWTYAIITGRAAEICGGAGYQTRYRSTGRFLRLS